MKSSERDESLREVLHRCIADIDDEMASFEDSATIVQIQNEAITAINSIWLDYILGLECMKPDRDYSKDNADEQSLRILVACANSCNDLRQQLKKELE